MFKSTCEFDEAVCEQLKRLITTGDFGFVSSQTSRQRFGDIMDFIEQNRLAIGFSGNRDRNGVYGLEKKFPPRITREGLEFIERRDNNGAGLPAGSKSEP